MIRPTFQAFETAKRALNVAQLGLDTVGHNISNAQTPGYTRQRVDQVSLSLNGYASKFAVFGVNSIGQGANVKGISQIRDPYLDNRYRNEAATNGELGVKSNGLTDINNIFDETTTDGLQAKLNDLYKALDNLSFYPDSRDLAAVVRGTAAQLVQLMNKSAAQLETARTEQKTELKVTVETDVNNILKQIADLNQRIEEDNFYGNPSNELNDERNLLIDKLSEYMDIKVVRTPLKMSNGVTIEELSIELKDVKDDNGNPLKLVDSNKYSTLKVNEDPKNGNVSISFGDGLLSSYKSGDITLFKGALKGYIDVINGAGPNAGAGVSTFRGIPYYQQSLDEFAVKLAEVFNRVNNISGPEADASGSKSDPPISLLSDTFGYKNLFVPLQPSLKGTVPEWMDSITSGSVQFSGGDYKIDFTYDSVNNKIVAELPDGNTFEADYTFPADSNKKIDFLNPDGSVAFSVNTTGVDFNASSSASVVVDAKITASNIAISSSWFDDALYMTATKFNPVTGAASKLTLTGGTTPKWLSSVESGGEGVTVKDGTYTFKYNSTAPATVEVAIGGTTYSALVSDFSTNGQVKFENSGVVGLIINTSNNPLNTTELPASITIRNESGAASDNILKFKEAMNSANGYAVSGFSGSFQEFLTSMYSTMSLDKELNDSLLDASLTVIGEYADRRDAVSAVSIDEEGINMMTYQNYYNAAARYMTTLDEALDKIINGMGVVGR